MYRNSNAARKAWAASGPAEDENVRAWRIHANEINNRIAARWKNGEPTDRRKPYITPGPVKVVKLAEIRPEPRHKSWSTL